MGKQLFIDGKKYNRGILDAVEALIEGKSIGSVDLEDAQRIWVYATKSGISASERRTLHYLLAQHEWDEDANSWFYNALHTFPESPRELVEKVLEEDFSLYHLDVELPTLLDLNTPVKLEQSVRLAIQSFLNSKEDNNVIGVIRRFFDIPSSHDSPLQDVLWDLFKHATMTLITKDVFEGDPPQPHLKPARNEDIDQNWIWGLSFHDIPSYYFWAVIDKEGDQDPYHYGMK